VTNSYALSLELKFIIYTYTEENKGLIIITSA